MPRRPRPAKDPTAFVFGAEFQYVGAFATDAMQVLVVTSLFAAFLAFHANTARYHFALARDGLLPRALARTHPKHGSPVGGSAAQLALTAIVVIAFALAGLDPYLKMGVALYGARRDRHRRAAGARQLRRDPLLRDESARASRAWRRSSRRCSAAPASPSASR